MIVFDSDKCFLRSTIDYSLLSIEDLDLYAKIFYDYATNPGFQHKTESVKMELNRIHKSFRLVMDDSSPPHELKWFSIYKNGNLKTLECLFHFLNFTFGRKNSVIDHWTIVPSEIDQDGVAALFDHHIKEKEAIFKNIKLFEMNVYLFKKQISAGENGCHFVFSEDGELLNIEKWKK